MHNKTGRAFTAAFLIALTGCTDQPAETTKPAGTNTAQATPKDSIGNKALTTRDKDSSSLQPFFRATGTEPSWSLEIDFSKSIKFKDVEGHEDVVAVGRGEKAMDANVVRYASQNEKVSIVVQIAKWACTNAMSGQKFDYTAMIDIQSKPNGPLRTYKGCGRYLSADSLPAAVSK